MKPNEFKKQVLEVCFQIVKEEKQKLGKEIQKLATEPIWDKNKDIRDAEFKTRTPKQLCEAIDDLVDFEEDYKDL